jgi:gliding motility-associated-like protein
MRSSYFSISNNRIVLINRSIKCLAVGIILFLSIQKSAAVITIHSVNTTVSTCGNNGTATISATSSKANPFLIYEIVAGPVTVPMQNNPTFPSLFPGIYTLRAYDIDFASKDVQFTITGNYQLPDLLPRAINPICPGFADGRIEGHLLPNKGLAPFSWQITSPFTGSVQSSDVFRDLTEGSYTLEVTDACGNVQSRTVILTAGSTGLAQWYDGIPSIQKTGCDTAILQFPIKLLKEKSSLPLKLSITTSSGNYSKTVFAQALDTSNYEPGFFNVVDTIPGITYNSYLYACLSDTCGNTICATRNYVAPFDFTLQYTNSTSCGNKMAADIYLVSELTSTYIYTGIKAPLKMTLIDLTTGDLADSASCDYSYCRLSIKEQISGRIYRLKITDGCGTVFQRDILWPVPAAPFVQISISPGCLDSTAAVSFTPYNFKSYLEIEILSGPSVVKSSKSHYTYSSPMSYPKLYPNSTGGISVKDFPIGTYTYRVSDTCGNTVNGSFIVDSTMVTDFHYSYSIKKGCLGNNILYFNALSNNTVAVYIRDLTTDELLFSRRGWLLTTQDSLTSLLPGRYELLIYYGFDAILGSGGYYHGTIADNTMDCWGMRDTIVILPPSNNSFQSHTTITCNGNIYTELNADTSRGVPPFQYEIISGPQTFPIQNNNLFQLPSFGDYIIRIRDACGNTNTRQISVDTAGLPPIIKSGAACTGSRIVLKGISSSYLQYQWTRPDGTVYTGDSLVIDPLTPADTGIYQITRAININGCSSTSHSTYSVYLHDELRQTIAFCNNSTVQVGSHVYSVSGDYIDTLVNVLGCDSIVYTTLIVAPIQIDTSQVEACEGYPVRVAGNVYTTTGFYKDSILNAAGCYNITYTDLTVLPYKRNTLTLSLCEGQQTTVGAHSYHQSGTYHDTLSTSSCDSIVTLHLTIKPYKINNLIRSICQGASVTVGAHAYTQSGTYHDTLSTPGCDSIVHLTLTVHPLPLVSLGKDTSLCSGQPLQLNAGLGFINYFWNGSITGTAQSTLAVHTTGQYTVQVEDVHGCLASDTVQLLNIYTLPTANAGPDDSLCAGETTILNATGGGTYLWMPGNSTQAQLSVHPTVTTTYTLTVYDLNHCEAADQVTVVVHPISTAAIFNEQQIGYCFDEGPLTLTANWGNTFLWTPGGEINPNLQVTAAGTYGITVSDAFACPYKAEVIVINRCETTLFIPTGFSPNGDGLHDDVEIFGNYFKDFRLIIFNRWGEIIFESSERELRWNGTYRGEEMPIGTYPWMVSYRSVFDEQKQLTQKGSITLVR